MSSPHPYTIEFYDPSSERHEQLADQLEAMRVAENPTMLPLGAKIMADHIVGILVSRGETAIGYNGVIYEYPEDRVAEIGGLYVNPEFRHQGFTRIIKANLFATIRQAERIERFVTFANGSSLALNLHLGFRPAEPHEVPRQSLNYCRTICPDYCKRDIGKVCCDTILTLESDKLPVIQPAELAPRAL